MLFYPMDQTSLLDDGRRFYPVLDGLPDFDTILSQAQVDAMRELYPHMTANGAIDFVDVQEFREGVATPEPTDEDIQAMEAAYAKPLVPALLPDIDI